MQFYNLKKSLGIYGLMIFVFVFSSCAAGQDFSRYDLSTDEGLKAAREAQHGKKLSEYGKNCVKRPAKLPEIILVGSFAHDRGCMLDGAFVEKYFLSGQENLSRAALKSLGWRKAVSNEREEMALKWTQFGLLAFGGYPLDKANEDFKDKEFHAPQASTDDAGVVNVTLWIRQPAGMRCQAVYNHLIFKFAADGSLSERQATESFSIPCKRN